MPPLLQIVVSNTLMATALALLVAVIAYVARRPAFAHVLWLLVLVKLVTPGIIPLPVSWPGTAEASSKPDMAAALNFAEPSDSPNVVPASDPPQEVTLLIYPDPDL